MEGARHVSKKERAAFFLLLLFPFLFVTATCKPKKAHMETRISVKGILQNTTGQPVKDVIVMIAGGSHEFNDMASVTNDSGEFYLSNVVVPGNYTLQIQGDSQSIKKEVHLTDSSTIRITF
jgi:hypothetical protein